MITSDFFRTHPLVKEAVRAVDAVSHRLWGLLRILILRQGQSPVLIKQNRKKQHIFVFFFFNNKGTVWSVIAEQVY